MDHVQNVTLSLLSNTDDLQTSALLLAVQSMSDARQRTLIEFYGALLDKILRNVTGQVSEFEKDRIIHLFSRFAMGVLSVSDRENSVAVRQKFADFGTTLMKVLNDDVSIEKRRAVYGRIRNLLRPVMRMADLNLEGQESVMNFVRGDGDPHKPKTYEITFAMNYPDLMNVCNTLRKLAGVLHQFQVKFDMDK
jgi:hypothetical protein